MLNINKKATAGTLESSDVLVTVKPNEEGIKIDLESDVQVQYGDEIIAVVENTIEELNIENAYIKVNDKGALDYAIKARLETALKRAL
mgnify:CR=1 FL=1